jgi:hypothetical protein
MGYLAAAAAAAMLAAGSACAEVVHFTAKLDGASETPPNDSAAKGSASVSLDTASKTLNWTVAYSGLSGSATMAHFHGPAQVGKTAGVAIPLRGDLASPIAGMATLTDPQIADVEAGLWYVNVHTAAHPGGEIRGQVLPVK